MLNPPPLPALFVGAIMGNILTILTEYLTAIYIPSTHNPDPERRLYASCLLSILFPIGMFWYGFTASPSKHWILPTLSTSCATIGIYSIYLAVCNYFADTYHRYASSALAAQGFSRNMMAAAFPLITDAMFLRLGFAGASSLLGGVAVLLTGVPWVLVFWGGRIRARSQFAKVSPKSPLNIFCTLGFIGFNNVGWSLGESTGPNSRAPCSLTRFSIANFYQDVKKKE